MPTHKALIFDEYNGPLEIRQVETSEPKDDELLVKMEYSGICHSDLHAWNGEFDFACKIPLIGGHEGAGSVVKVGSKVKGWSVGDHAGVKLVNSNCLNCEYCKNGHEPLCLHIENFGMDRHGTFQEYITIRDVDAIKIKKSTNLAVAGPVLCGGVTAYKALKETGAKPGQYVAITGAGGGLGSFGIQYATAMGLRVVALDHKSKEDHCRKLGAEFFIDAFETPNVVEKMSEVTNGGPHGVVNFASAKKPMEEALLYVRRKGTVVLVGLPKDGTIPLNTALMIFNLVTVKGSMVGSRLDVDEAMEFVSRGIVNIPVDLVKLEDVSKVFDRMKDGKINSRCVVDFSL